MELLETREERAGYLIQGGDILTYRATLITRLSSADASAHLPPVPPLPARPSGQSKTAKASSTRAISSSKFRSADLPKSGDTVTSTGPEVASQRDEAPKKEDIEPEEVTTAPGLPETATVSAADARKGEELTPKIPDMERSEKKIEQVIVSFRRGCLDDFSSNLIELSDR